MFVKLPAKYMSVPLALMVKIPNPCPKEEVDMLEAPVSGLDQVPDENL